MQERKTLARRALAYMFRALSPSRRQASLTGVRQASQDPSRLFGHDHDHRLSRWFDEALLGHETGSAQAL